MSQIYPKAELNLNLHNFSIFALHRVFKQFPLYVQHHQLNVHLQLFKKSLAITFLFKETSVELSPDRINPCLTSIR